MVRFYGEIMLPSVNHTDAGWRMVNTTSVWPARPVSKNLLCEPHM